MLLAPFTMAVSTAAFSRLMRLIRAATDRRITVRRAARARPHVAWGRPPTPSVVHPDQEGPQRRVLITVSERDPPDPLGLVRVQSRRLHGDIP
jgi:hypothetical protein